MGVAFCSAHSSARELRVVGAFLCACFELLSVLKNSQTRILQYSVVVLCVRCAVFKTGVFPHATRYCSGPKTPSTRTRLWAVSSNMLVFFMKHFRRSEQWLLPWSIVIRHLVLARGPCLGIPRATSLVRCDTPLYVGQGPVPWNT